MLKRHRRLTATIYIKKTIKTIAKIVRTLSTAQKNEHQKTTNDGSNNESTATEPPH